MRAEKRAPGHRPLTAGWNAFRFQDARNRGSRHAMANVLQRSLNTGVAPVRILRRHPNHEAPNLSEHPRPPWSSPCVGPFPRNQFAMPSKNRVRRDERRHLSQNAASKSLPEHREPPSLGIVQPQPASSQLCFWLWCSFQWERSVCRRCIRQRAQGGCCQVGASAHRGVVPLMIVAARSPATSVVPDARNERYRWGHWAAQTRSRKSTCHSTSSLSI